jgi:hypothetical protein
MPEHADFEQYLATFVSRLRELIAESREMLREPLPDTFLGRKTQEPFPNENDSSGPLS